MPFPHTISSLPAVRLLHLHFDAMPGRLAVAPLLLFFLLSACDNPTGVGSDLVGEQGGDPVEIPVVPIEMVAAAEADITGGSGTQQRILVGMTQDPDLGGIQATGHVDFVIQATGLSSNFTANPVTEVTLFLDRVYAYGDTSGTLGIQFHDLADEWTATAARADTTFATAASVTEHTFDVTTTTVEVPLPADWISRWDATLRSATFGEDFHGFRIAAVAGDVVVGFDQFGSFLRAVAGGDTAYFPAARTHSFLEFQEPATPFDDAVLLQDGRGIGTVLRFDFDDDRLDAIALSRVRLELPFDSTLSNEAPAGYVRPAANIAGLMLDAVSIDPDARYSLDATASVVDGRIRFESSDLISVVQLVLDGGSSLDHFEVRVNPVLISLDVIRFASPTNPTAVPRVVLTAVPFE